MNYIFLQSLKIFKSVKGPETGRQTDEFKNYSGGSHTINEIIWFRRPHLCR